MTPITTNTLREHYGRNAYSFGNPGALVTICLIGSCRIIPFVNNLILYNSLHDHPFRMLCFNPVEMWVGPGHEVKDGVNSRLADYRFDKVDFLVCEHVERCGVLNTVRSSEQNVFDSLGCRPEVEIRLPNWNNMHIFDVETAGYNKEYAALAPSDRVPLLRDWTMTHKNKFLHYCRTCSIPDIADWVDQNWTEIRFGWTSNHPTFELVWTLFIKVASVIGLEKTNELLTHADCCSGIAMMPKIDLTSVDYEANNWKY